MKKKKLKKLINKNAEIAIKRGDQIVVLEQKIIDLENENKNLCEVIGEYESGEIKTHWPHCFNNDIRMSDVVTKVS